MVVVGLECRGLECEAGTLVKAEHEVHILHCLTGSALEEIVDYADDKQLIALFYELYERFVGIDDLLEVYCARMHESEGCAGIEVVVKRTHFVLAHARKFYGCCHEDSSGEIASHGYETQFGIACRLESGQRHAYFFEMLVRERLVDRQIIVSPAEMCCRTGLYAGTCGAGDAGYGHVAV